MPGLSVEPSCVCVPVAIGIEVDDRPDFLPLPLIILGTSRSKPDFFGILQTRIRRMLFSACSDVGVSENLGKE